MVAVREFYHQPRCRLPHSLQTLRLAHRSGPARSGQILCAIPISPTQFGLLFGTPSLRILLSCTSSSDNLKRNVDVY
jgi:hypothetical protein